MTPLDWIVVAVLLLSAFRGLQQGLLRELFALAGAIAGWVLACRYTHALAPVMLRVTRNLWWAEIFSFLAIVIAVMLTTHLLARLLRGGMRAVGLGWLDRLAGLVFGLVRGVVLVAIGFIVLSLFFPESDWVRHSRLAPMGLTLARTMATAAPLHMADRIRYGARLLHLQLQGAG